MNDRKNIDRLFQERFKDFESLPDNKVWDHIHDALHEKKKRRIIPLWWKLSGIAAGFVLAFLAFSVLTTTFDGETTVVNAPEEFENTNPSLNNVNPTTETSVVLESEEPSVKENNTNENSLNAIEATENKIATDNTNSSESKSDVEINSNQNARNNTKIAADNTNSSENKSDAKGQSNQNSRSKIRNNVPPKKGSNSNLNTTAVANNLQNNQKQNNSANQSTSEKTLILTTTEKSSEKNQVVQKGLTPKTDVVGVLNTDHSFSKTGTPKSASQEKDSTALVVATQTNPLEEILRKKNEKGEEVLATAALNRWQVTTNVAPVYFNSASNGSPIESQFAENSKTYENNLSVGVGVQYAVNKKLAVRTGVNKMTLGYGTNDVLFFGALNSPGVTTLSADASTANFEVISAYNSEALRPFEDNLQNMESGVLNQQMGYYEVPLELSYSVINRKFGVHVIGGMSTLFLNENSVSVQSSTTTISLGQANNLNEVHFSSNIGLGFRYEFWKNFEARFEPTFKYQFNTFTRDAGNFKPYFVGLYTGVSYRF